MFLLLLLSFLFCQVYLTQHWILHAKLLWYSIHYYNDMLCLVMFSMIWKPLKTISNDWRPFQTIENDNHDVVIMSVMLMWLMWSDLMSNLSATTSMVWSSYLLFITVRNSILCLRFNQQQAIMIWPNSVQFSSVHHHHHSIQYYIQCNYYSMLLLQ